MIESILEKSIAGQRLEPSDAVEAVRHKRYPPAGQRGITADTKKA